MQTIHGAELFNCLAPLKEGLRVVFRKAEDQPPVSEQAASLRQIAHKYFGVDAPKLDRASDEQVVASLGYVDHIRSASRQDAQIGMLFCLAGIAAPLMVSSVSFPLIYGTFGIYKLMTARQKEEKAVLQAKRGEGFLGDVPKYNSTGQLQMFV